MRAAIAFGLFGLAIGLKPLEAQVVGTSSLVTIPVADMPADGSVTFGGGFVDKRYSDYLDGRVDYTPFYLSMEFLPFLELGFRFSRPVNLDDKQRLGDRMVSARLRVLTERRKRPAVVIGVHDFLTVERRDYFNALYIVGSKHLDVLRPVGLHAGYGTDLMAALAHQFVGLFGGVSFQVIQQSEILFEFDGERLNGGLRLTLLDRRVRALVALQGMNAIIAGASIVLQL